MSNFKKGISILLTGVVAIACVVTLSATAYASMDFTHNWTNDTTPIGIPSRRRGIANFNINPSTGRITVAWTSFQSCFNNLHGVGWRVGTHNRRIGYNVGYLNHTSGTDGMTIATFYGWTRNPMIEYYVIEMWRNYRPTPGQRIGTLNSDGGTYEIWRAQRNTYNIDGFGPFIQLKSVRTVSAPTEQNRTITFQNHVNAWRMAGQPLGSVMHYQVFQLEGLGSSGSAAMTVWPQ